MGTGEHVPERVLNAKIRNSVSYLRSAQPSPPPPMSSKDFEFTLITL